MASYEAKRKPPPAKWSSSIRFAEDSQEKKLNCQQLLQRVNNVVSAPKLKDIVCVEIVLLNRKVIGQKLKVKFAVGPSRKI